MSTHRDSDDHKARFTRIAELFEAARALGVSERAAYLAQACDEEEVRAEVESLLALDEPESFDGPSAFDSTWALDALSVEVPGSSVSVDPLPPKPTSIGPYRILRELGSGGMGRVYLGRREDAGYDKDVAVKVLRSGMESDGILTRFRAERRILAGLDHPNIATLLDGGATESGLPYLVVEYIDGQDLVTFAREHRLSVAARIDLFGKICDAVTALHRSLIVHRDLKPSNIMVTSSGVPKLLDFGIAKILDPGEADDTVLRTSTGMLLFTPEYGSPEQSRGEPITTSSDVYSLGVILYELLAGQRPYAFETKSPASIERVLSELTPPTMSSVAKADQKALTGDLDTIVAKALRKEPDRRYSSVALFQEDLERFSAGLPVRARPDTFRYRATKFVRRRLGAVVGSIAFLALLLGGTVAVAVQAERTARQRDLADERAEIAGEVSRFLVELFRVSAPDEAVGELITARSLLDRGSNLIQHDLQKGAGVRAELMKVMGRAYLALGNVDEAADLLLRAESLIEGDPAKIAELAMVRGELGAVRIEQGEAAAAEAMLQESVSVLEQHLGSGHREAMTAKRRLADLLRDVGRLDEALALAEEVRETASAEPIDERELLHAMVLEAGIRETRGDYAEAERLLLEAKGRQMVLFGGDHPDIAGTQRLLALLYNSQGRLDDGIEAIQEAIRIDRAIMGDDHPNVDDSMFSLAALYKEAGDLDQALQLYRDIMDRDRERYGEHPYVALDMGNIAGILMALGDLDEAEEMYREGLALQRRLLPPSHPEIATTLSNLGGLLRRQSKHTDAATHLEEALAMRRKVFPADHPAVLTSLNMLAVSYQDQGRHADALALAQQVLATRETKLGEHPQVAGSCYSVGTMLAALGRDEEAEVALRRSIRIYSEQLPPGHLDLARPLAHLGRELARRGDTKAARPLLEQALEIRAARLPKDHRAVTSIEQLLRSMGE